MLFNKVFFSRLHSFSARFFSYDIKTDIVMFYFMKEKCIQMTECVNGILMYFGINNKQDKNEHSKHATPEKKPKRNWPRKRAGCIHLFRIGLAWGL